MKLFAGVTDLSRRWRLSILNGTIREDKRMYAGKLVFAQTMEHLPLHTFHRCVERYGGDYRMRRFSCLDQYLAMAFAQLSFRESLRDIEACLAAHHAKLYHMGIRGRVSRSTLADANERRDWRIYADFAQSLIITARRLYADAAFAVELDHTVYALDSTTIDLCLTLFPWAPFMRSKAAVKLHTLLDLRGNIPSFIHISHGRWNDMRALDELIPEPGALYVMDRGYLDFARLYRLTQAAAFFVIRAKRNFKFYRVQSRPVDGESGLICDQTVRPSGVRAPTTYPERLRRIKYRDAESGRIFIYLSNNFTLPALTIAELYKCRWQVELFFKWIKQHLRIKRFFGTSENAVKTQIWIAVSVYLLIAILKKSLDSPLSLYTIMQILSVTIFEKTPLNQLLRNPEHTEDRRQDHNQLNLFGY